MPAIDDVLTMWPPLEGSRINGTNVLITLTAPPRLTAMARSQSTKLGSATAPPPAMPALLHNTWMRPNAAVAASAASATEVRSVTSTRNISTSAPDSSKRASAMLRSLTSPTTTFIPSDSSALVIPSPMPLAPPVTNAVLPAKFLTARPYSYSAHAVAIDRTPSHTRPNTVSPNQWTMPTTSPMRTAIKLLWRTTSTSSMPACCTHSSRNRPGASSIMSAGSSSEMYRPVAAARSARGTTPSESISTCHRASPSATSNHPAKARVDEYGKPLSSAPGSVTRTSTNTSAD